MNQYEFIDPATGHRSFASTEQELQQRLPQGIAQRGRGNPAPQPMTGPEAKDAYLEYLKETLLRSKMEQAVEKQNYNPTLGELGVGNQGAMGQRNQFAGPQPGAMPALPPGLAAPGGQPAPDQWHTTTGNGATRGPAGSATDGSVSGGGGSLGNVRRREGTGPSGSAIPEYYNLRPGDQGFDPRHEAPPLTPEEEVAAGRPEMRLRELQMTAENTAHLGKYLQETILGKILGVKPEHAMQAAERALARKDAADDRAESLAARKDAAALALKERRADANFRNAGNLFNKKTGKSLAESGVDYADDATIRAELMPLDDGQRKAKEGFAKFDALVEKYEAAVHELGYGKTGLGAGIKAADLKRLEAMKDPRIANLRSLESQLSTITVAFGDEKRMSESDAIRAAGAIPGLFESAEGAQRKIQNLKDFRDTGVKAMGLTWMPLHNEKQAKQDESVAAIFEDFNKAMKSGGNPSKPAKRSDYNAWR